MDFRTFYNLRYDKILLYFIVQAIPAWPMGALAEGSLPFPRPSSRGVSERALTFLTTWRSTLILAQYLVPQSQNQPLLHGALGPFAEEEY